MPGYGNRNFGSSTTNTTVKVDSAQTQHAIFFVSASNYTLTGNGFTFYDYSGYQSRIENNGAGIRLGNDDGSSVTVGTGTNTVSLISATGGQNIASVLVMATGCCPRTTTVA